MLTIVVLARESVYPDAIENSIKGPQDPKICSLTPVELVQGSDARGESRALGSARVQFPPRSTRFILVQGSSIVSCALPCSATATVYSQRVCYAFLSACVPNCGHIAGSESLASTGPTCPLLQLVLRLLELIARYASVRGHP